MKTLDSFWKTSAIVVAVAFTGTLRNWGGAFEEEQLVQVSGPSPFTGCTADLVGGQAGPPVLNTEFEPYLAVNPTNPRNAVAIWGQDFLTNANGQVMPGVRGMVAGVTFNGGSAWSEVVLPGYSPCSGPTEFGRSGDEWVTFAPNGDLYATAVALLPVPAGGIVNFDQQPTAVLVSKSTNGGSTWGPPTALFRDDKFLNDKGMIVADPFNANFVYAAWTRRSNKGFQTMFSRTTDAGLTWEPARVIDQLEGNNQLFANQIVVLPDGTLVNFFTEILAANNQTSTLPFNHTLALIRSTDRGVTLSPTRNNQEPIPVADMEIGCPQYPFLVGACVPDPDNNQQHITTSSVVFDAKVDPNSGNLYVVWEGWRFNSLQYSQIAFSMSSDGGFTWSAPVKINQTPASAALANRNAFRPAVAVGADGTVAVTYYDYRFNDANPGALTDYWLVHCHPTTPTSCTDTADWSSENRLTDSSFDLEKAPLNGNGNFFLGDYMGLQASGGSFLALFGQTQATDHASIFFRLVGD